MWINMDDQEFILDSQFLAEWSETNVQLLYFIAIWKSIIQKHPLKGNFNLNCSAWMKNNSY